MAPGLGLQPAPRRIGIGDALVLTAHLALDQPALGAQAARPKAVREDRGEARSREPFAPSVEQRRELA